jgi:hypothetical protein
MSPRASSALAESEPGYCDKVAVRIQVSPFQATPGLQSFDPKKRRNELSRHTGRTKTLRQSELAAPAAVAFSMHAMVQTPCPASADRLTYRIGRYPLFGIAPVCASWRVGQQLSNRRTQIKRKGNSGDGLHNTQAHGDGTHLLG